MAPLRSIIALIGMAVGTAACAEDACPADRPNRRQLTDYSAVVTCSAVNIVRMMCPPDGANCSRFAVSTCPAPPTSTVCLSDEELAAAMKENQK